jgi:hypothetical protein
MRIPAGPDALREHAIETARRALSDAGRELSDGDPLAAELVDVAVTYDLPLSTIVSYVHFQPRGRQVTAENFAKHCAALRDATQGPRSDTVGDGGMCPQCHAHPVRRVGAFFVCAGGRCAPRVA